MRDSQSTKHQSRLIRFAAWPFVIAGFGHALLTVPDLFGPGVFSPTDPTVRPLMEETGIVLMQTLGSSESSLWQGYVGFNLSHGIGVGFFGLIHLLLARYDVTIFQTMPWLLPFSFVMALSWFFISLSSWFYAPTLTTAWGTVCFLLALLQRSPSEAAS